MKNGHFLFCELGLCRSQINKKLKLENVLVIIVCSPELLIKKKKKVCSPELVIMMLMLFHSSS